MPEKDIEEYTPNELAFGVIKQLRRLADAFERQNGLLAESLAAQAASKQPKSEDGDGGAKKKGKKNA